MLKSARNRPSEGRFGRHSLITRKASACITVTGWSAKRFSGRSEAAPNFLKDAAYIKAAKGAKQKAYDSPMIERRRGGDSFPLPRKVQLAMS